ncbi:histidine kinase [Flavivirga amylovorans]|uniref:Histidine kinase n=1 Tax=Flavivirga amylovorans TaxID=870486 RepID=A0ABT8WWC2_9FLAO|nr:histidine kinase [Flavivirga amylovorans]MDO5985792.1 histidine kinase [Flavivirga amylovorans]
MARHFNQGKFLKASSLSQNAIKDSTDVEVEKALLKALDKANRSNDINAIVTTNLNLIRYYRQQDIDETEMLNLFDAFNKSCEKFQDTTCFTQYKLSLGEFYFKKTSYTDAIDELNQALEYAKIIEDKSLILAVKNTKGRLFTTIGEQEKGRKEFRGMIKYLDVEEKDYEIWFNAAYMNIAYTYKNPDSLIFYSSIVADKCKSGEMEVGCDDLYNNIAYAYLRKNMPEKALHTIQNNIDLDNLRYSSDDDNFYTSLTHTLGTTYFKLEQYEASIKYYKKSLYYSEIENNLPDIIETKEDLALSYERIGDKTTALRLLRETRILIEQYNNQRLKEEIANVKSKYELQEKEQEIISLEKENEEFKFATSKAKSISYILFVSLIVILLALYYYKQKNKLKFYKLNEELTINRLKSLRSVMNPHFLFNSFSTLQNYILKKESIKANDYMTDISNLIREVLAGSDNIYTKFNDELALIKSYLKIEQGRFDPEFKVIYNIDSELINTNPIIPSMIIQPHIENAILHGISNNLEDAVIKVSLNKKGKLVICIIEDNGVGREKAGFIKDHNNTPIHLSIASKNIQERLRILSKIGFKNTSINVIDIYDDEGMPSGTKVVITLPTQKKLN